MDEISVVSKVRRRVRSPKEKRNTVSTPLSEMSLDELFELEAEHPVTVGRPTGLLALRSRQRRAKPSGGGMRSMSQMSHRRSHKKTSKTRAKDR